MKNRKAMQTEPIHLRVTLALLRKIDGAAWGDRRSRSNWIRLTLERATEKGKP